MFPITLVTYPILAVVAMLHGVLAVAKNLGTIIMAPFAVCSVARIVDGKIDPEGDDGGVPYCLAVCAGISLLVGTVTRVAILDGGYGGFFSRAPGDTYMRVLGVVWATNVLSCLYEGGRVYCNYLTGSASSRQAGAKPSRSETAEKKAMTPQTFLTMFSKIEERDSIPEDEADKIFADVISLMQDGKLKPKEVRQLCRMIAGREVPRV